MRYFLYFVCARVHVCVLSGARALLAQREAGRVKKKQEKWDESIRPESCRTNKNPLSSFPFLPRLPFIPPLLSCPPLPAHSSSPLLYRSSSSSSFSPLKHKTLVILMNRSCPEGVRHGESEGEGERMPGK